MRCRVVRDRLSAFIDAELPDAERRAVERHLEGCPACAALHRRIAAAWALVPEAPRVAPRVDLWPRIEARLDGTRPVPAWRAWFDWTPFPALATLALVVGLAIGVWMGESVARAGGSGTTAVDVRAGRVDVQYLGDVFPGSLAEVVLEVTSPRAAPGVPEATR